MTTLFEKIVAGEIPSHRVWESDTHLAFLDIQPRAVGHTLVIPKRATDYIFDLPADEHAALWEAVREVAAKLQAALGSKRILVYVVGWEVPHVHVHLIPSDSIHDVPFPPPSPQAVAALDQTAAVLAP
ncbi:HIT family protein [Engelhardtia mirabilis]|uniref:HIT-like protein n=1 Tax=Engelhardtia mirabilis TaxID=2528011 RepID=A0A518BR68_9BACT|nr:HIT-like protein [Planctomycetes bacterium Pla133]QDV03785.1 HIT-like protein [Planctomycetes bacterium Pla86]